MLQVRDRALFGHVEGLRARKAALEAGLAPVLARYDVLTSRLPLARLQVLLLSTRAHFLKEFRHACRTRCS